MKIINRNVATTNLAFMTAVAVIGMIVFDITPFITANSFVTIQGMTFWKLIDQTLKYAFYPAGASLFIAGCILGFLRPSKWLIIGMVQVVFLPLTAIIDAAMKPTSHNLLFLEFVMYFVFFGVPSLAGAFLGGRIRTGETVWDRPK